MDAVDPRRTVTVRLREFELDQPLGRGGMGAVWAARHLPTGSEVAVKVAFGARSAEGRRVADVEARAIAALSHPGVVRLHAMGLIPAEVAPALGVPPGAPWLAMERARGALPHGPCGGAVLADRLGQILDALAHAHARGVLHLDLKPANVLVADDGSLLLADFGIARLLGEGDEPGRIRGSLPTMAPEQLGGGPLGPWTDLYAVGCMAAAWVTGGWPWPDLAAGPAFEVRRREPVRLAVDTPFAEWVARLTMPRSEDRPTSAARAALALRALRLPEGPGLDAMAATLATMDDEGAVRPSPLSVAPAPRRRRGRASLEATSADLIPFRRWPLVGREAVLAALAGELAEVAATRTPRVVGLRGGPGFGRTAALRACLEAAAEAGLAMTIGLCGPSDTPDLVRVDAGHDPADVLGCAAARPVILAIDDAADRPRWSRRLAGWLAADAPLLVVVTARTEDVVHLRGVERWHDLPPLADGEIDELVASLVDLDPELRGRLVARAAGCPRYVVATLEAWAASARLVPGRHGLHIAGEEPALASDLASALRAPLAPWIREDHEAVGALAVLADPVDLARWRAVAPTASDRLLAGLEATGTVTVTAEGVRWTSDAIRASVVESLPTDLGRRLHERALGSLAADAPALERGRHSLGAGLREQARAPLLRAVSARLAAGDVRGASVVAGELDQALAGLPDDDPERAGLRLASAQVALLQGRAPASIDEAARAARLTRDPALRARALQVGAAATQRAGDLRGALELLERALEAFEGVGDGSRCVECLASSEEILTMLGEEAAADAALARALARVDRADDSVAGVTFARQGWRLVSRGRPREALAALDRADERFARTGQALLSAVVATYRAAAHRGAGDVASARREYARAVDGFRAAGSADEDVARLGLLGLACDADRPEDVLGEADRVARRLGRLGRRAQQSVALAMAAWARARLGEAEGLEEDLEVLAAHLATTGLGLSELRDVLARLADALRDRPALAERVRRMGG